MTEPAAWLYLVAALAVAVGASLQRVSGTGLGLVLGPTIAVLLGPTISVLFVNATGAIVSTLIISTVWRHIDWRRARAMVGWSIPGSAVGLWLLSVIPSAALTASIGAIVLLGLGITFTLRRVPHLDGPVTTASAGALSGVLNAGSGIPAPVLVVYSRLSRWEHTSFVATLQPIFIGMGVLAIAGNLLIAAVSAATGTTAGPDVGPLPPWWVAIAVMVAALVGIVVGNRLAHRVPPRRAQQLTVVLAALAGVAALVRGVVGLLGA